VILPTLAIDCGSTNLKAAVFDDALNRLSEHAVPLAYLVHDGVRVEFDGEAAWESVVTLITEVCRGAGVAASEAKRIAFASQAQTFTFVDQGRPLFPFMSWIDRRAVAESAELSDRLGCGFHQHCSFSGPVPQLQLSKLLWVGRHRSALPKQNASMVSLPGFFALRLGGVNAVDRNLAAMSGLYSLAREDWWLDALACCGLVPEVLPALVDVGAAVRVQQANEEVGVAPDAELVFAGNDQTAGAFGNDCAVGGMVVTLGTALVVYRYAGETPGPYHEGGCWGPYPGGGYYELAARDEGCLALDRARKVLLPAADVEQFMRCAADGAPGAEACFFYPERTGAGPAWVGEGDLAARAFAVVEGISFSLRNMIRDDLKCDRSPSVIAVTGGGANSNFWLQLLANVLNCPVGRGEGDSLLGAAKMAAPGSAGAGSGIEPPMAPSTARAQACERRYQAWLEQRRAS